MNPYNVAQSKHGSLKTLKNRKSHHMRWHYVMTDIFRDYPINNHGIFLCPRKLVINETLERITSGAEDVDP